MCKRINCVDRIHGATVTNDMDSPWTLDKLYRFTCWYKKDGGEWQKFCWFIDGVQAEHWKAKLDADNYEFLKQWMQIEKDETLYVSSAKLEEIKK